MLIIIGIIIAVIIFSIIILAHEYGHFKTARIFGVRVEEFGLGIPPRAKKLFIDKKGTLYSLNWLPLGGFVKLTGENINTFYVFDKNQKLYNNEDLEKDIKDGKDIFDKDGNKLLEIEKKEILKKLKENTADYSLQNKASWKQAIIILAGVFMNFLLAIVIFSILFFIGVKPIGINDKIDTDLNLKLIPTKKQAIESGLITKKLGVILYPIEGSIAKKSNLKEGDILYEVVTCETKMQDFVICEGGEDPIGHKINSPEDLINIIKNNSGTDVAFYMNARVLEGEEKEQYKSDYIGGGYYRVSIPKEGKIGSYIGENIELNNNFIYKYGFFESIKYGSIETYNQTMLTFKGLSILIKKIFNPETPEERQEAIEQVSGPIGMVDFISKSISGGIIFLLIIGAIISINLGVFNLLPIPALDGGRFIFITINGILKKIFGRKIINEQTETIIHFLFFVVLIALSLIIAYNDIIKIINN